MTSVSARPSEIVLRLEPGWFEQPWFEIKPKPKPDSEMRLLFCNGLSKSPKETWVNLVFMPDQAPPWDGQSAWNYWPGGYGGHEYFIADWADYRQPIYFVFDRQPYRIGLTENTDAEMANAQYRPISYFHGHMCHPEVLDADGVPFG